MIMVTGGAGFIGSNLRDAAREQDALREQGEETVPDRIIHPHAIHAFLATHPPSHTIVHLGAISETAPLEEGIRPPFLGPPRQPDRWL